MIGREASDKYYGDDYGDEDIEVFLDEVPENRVFSTYEIRQLMSAAQDGENYETELVNYFLLELSEHGIVEYDEEELGTNGNHSWEAGENFSTGDAIELLKEEPVK